MNICALRSEIRCEVFRYEICPDDDRVMTTTYGVILARANRASISDLVAILASGYNSNMCGSLSAVKPQMSCRQF